MSSRNGNTQDTRTWYRLNATVALGPGFLHRVGFGKFLIPHPPAVNWVLRRGLGVEKSKALCFSHEFGHLQTAPFALVYFGLTMGFALHMGHRGLMDVLLQLACAQAAWEIASELHAIRSNPGFYRDSYRMISVTPRAVFWTLAGALVIIGWIIAVA